MTMDRRKPEVGEKLICVRTSRGQWSISNTEVVTVAKVGRKYFYVKRTWGLIRFRIKTWQEATEYEAEYNLYESLDEFRKAILGEAAHRYVRDEITSWGGREITHEQWLKMAEILNWDQKGDIPLQGRLEALEMTKKRLEASDEGNG